MIFNSRPTLTGTHAFLSASNNAWVRYSEEKLDRVFLTSLAAKRGTELHELAQRLIKLGVKLPSSRRTLHLYVNDAIGYRMTPEQILYYSDNCYGTADAISFRRNKLRIHDLKTGVIETSVRQLEVYAALFCLEYGYKPSQIEIELRIYQNDEVRVYDADAEAIEHIMERIVSFDKRIELLKLEALG